MRLEVRQVTRILWHVPALLTITGGVLAVVGSFLPWATVTCQCYLDPTSVMYMGAGVSPIVHGTDTPNLDGSTLAWAGAIVILLGVVAVFWPAHRRPLLAAAFAAAAFSGLLSIPDIQCDIIGAALGMSGGYSVDAGVYLANAGIVTAAIASLVGVVIGRQFARHDPKPSMAAP